MVWRVVPLEKSTRLRVINFEETNTIEYMEKELSIHVKYNSNSCILLSKPSELLAKAAAKYYLNEREIEMYEIEKNISRKTDVNGLKDFMHLEIKKKPPVSNKRINGQRSPKSMKVSHEDNVTSAKMSTSKVSHENNATSSKIPTVAEILQKLKNNSLSDLERQYLIRNIESLPLYLVQKWESGNPQLETKNRKIQANPVEQKLAHTQTDKLIEFGPKTSTKNRLTNDVHQKIKLYSKKAKKDPEQVAKLMTETYDDRRNFVLIQMPKVQLMKEKYPLLFNLSEVRNELDRLFYNGKCDDFIRNIGMYADTILSMAQEDEPLLLTIREKEKLYETPPQKRYVLEVGSILMLSKLIQEPRNYLKLEDITIDVEDHPYIEGSAKLNEIFFDQYNYKIFTENVLICEAENFKEAILCLVASYFIFNISYPDNNFNTLVAMEKLYLEGLDTEDSEIDDYVRQLIKTVKLKCQTKKRLK